MILSDETSDSPLLHVGALATVLRGGTENLRVDSPNGLNKFLWVTKGNGRAMIEGTQKGFGPNTILFLPANIPHSIDFSQTVSGTILTIENDSDFVLPNKVVFQPILNILEQAQTTAHFDNVVREFNREKIGRETALKCYIGLLTVHIERHVSKYFRPTRTTASHRLMARFTNSLECNFRTDHSLTSYAQQLDVTPTHLTRVSRKLNGRSASSLIQQRLLNEAQNMLLNTDLKVHEISLYLGFGSPAYFTRLFSQKIHQTPKDFRKSGKRGPEEFARQKRTTANIFTGSSINKFSEQSVLRKT